MLVWLVRSLRDAGVRLAGDLIVESVIEEEISGNGTLACAASGYRADAAVVVDGRGPGNAVTAHCGQLWFRAAVRGRTAAAVESWRGRNAIEMLVPVIGGLRELEASLAGAASAPFDRVERPVQLNIGVVQGGSTPTTVPGSAFVDGHLTFPGPLTLSEVKSKVVEAITRVGERERWTGELAPSVQFLSLQVPPFAGPASDELLSELDRAQRGVLGTALEERAVAGFGDLRHFQLGGPTPCCLYGPTTGGGPHAANEWVDLAALRDSALVLASFVTSWCGTA
jgi:acetylornithine deacetylase